MRGRDNERGGEGGRESKVEEPRAGGGRKGGD